MDNFKKSSKNQDDNYSLLTPEVIINNYNKLNGIANETLYPWDLRKKKVQDYFVPTYKNVILYYKDNEALLKAPAPARKSKSKKGGNENKVQVFFI